MFSKFKILSILFVVISLNSCMFDDEEPFLNEGAIYNEQNSQTLKNIILIVKPFVLVDSDKHYIATDMIKNVEISINGKKWGVYNSIVKNTSTISQITTTGNYQTSANPLKYSIIASLGNNQTDTLSTAGDFANYLNEDFTLSHGTYVCDVTSMQIKQNDGTVKTINPLITEILEVKQEQKNIFLGEFEIQITE